MSSGILILSLLSVGFWILVFTLHRLRFKLTLVPLYGLIAALVAYTHILSSFGASVTQGNLFFLVSSTAYFTSLLLGILLIYLFDGVEAARKGLEILVMVSFLQIIVVYTLHLIDPGHTFIPSTIENFKNYFWSITAMVADVVFMVIMWEWLSKIRHFTNYLKVPLLIFLVLTLDAFIFVSGVFAGTGNYLEILKSDIIVRFFLATIMGTVIAAYLTNSKYSEKERDKPRKVWDILDFRSALVRKVKSLEEIIRERQILEKKLRANSNDLAQAKAQSEAVLASIAEGLVVVASNGKFLFFNEQAKEILGLGPQKVVVTLWPKVYGMYYLNQEKVMSINDFQSLHALRGHSVMGEKIRIKNENIKSFKTIKINASPIKIASNIMGAAFTFTDITKEQEIEKAKDEFLSMASHELRTPLAAIDGIVAMIRDGEYGKISDEVRGGLDDVNTASENLIRLVNDLLSVSRIEAGRLKYNLSDFDINSVIKQVVDLYTPLATEQGLKLDITEVPKVIVQADQDKVNQIITNLISNSLKFTEKGKIIISVKHNGDYLDVSVSDTGRGIAKKDCPKLFGKFQQVGAESRKGSGLGLFIAKQMALKMGGDLILKSSRIGKGSVFALSLPKEGTDPAVRARREIEKEASLHPDQKSDNIEKK